MKNIPCTVCFQDYPCTCPEVPYSRSLDAMWCEQVESQGLPLTKENVRRVQFKPLFPEIGNSPEGWVWSGERSESWNSSSC